MEAAVAAPEVQVPEEQSTALVREVQVFRQTIDAVRIVDQPSYDNATGLLLEIKAKRKRISEFFGPMKQLAYASWKKICERENEVEKPLVDAEAHIKREVSRYTTEQEQARLQAEKEAREAAELAQAEMIEDAVEEAEAAGATAEEVKAIIDQPLAMPAPRVAPTFVQNKSVSTRAVYRAEVTSMRELARAVAEGRAASTLLQPNMTALNQMATAQKSEFSIPGCRLVVEQQVAARAK